MDEFYCGQWRKSPPLRTERRPDRGGRPFLEAGIEPRGLSQQNTVSPSTELNNFEEGSDEEESEREEDLGLGEVPVKVKVKKEKDFVRKLADPRMPTEEERKMHWLQGHYPYTETPPTDLRRRKGKFQSMDLITTSQVTS